MDLTTFAINDGFPEAILRGWRSSFLSDSQYNQIKSCNTISEIKTFLEETDYGPFLQSSEPDIKIIELRQKLKLKLAGEIEYLMAQCVSPLFDFLHLISQRYMLENVVNMIEGLKNKIDPNELISKADPLGPIPEMKNIKILEGDDYTQLYRDVLIDSQVGQYFKRQNNFVQHTLRYIEEQISQSQSENRTLQEGQKVVNEIRPEQMRNSLKRMWLEDFYEFCAENLNSTSSDMLLDLLRTEADFKTIQVAFNTMGQRNASQAKIQSDRKQLFPQFGLLYPDRYQSLLNCKDFDSLQLSVKGCDNYEKILGKIGNPLQKEEHKEKQDIKEDFSEITLDDYMFNDEARRYALAFDQGAQYAVFYAYLKLKEQEIKNIIWLTEMIQFKVDKKHPGFKKIIIPFADLSSGIRNN